MSRESSVIRKTRETRISVELVLDGEGKTEVSTTVGFLDHMLELFGKHSLFDLKLSAEGDTTVDFHHTVEDIGISLGEALDRALTERKGIRRFASASVPMDEALAIASLDLSGRPFLVFNVQFPTEKTGEFDMSLIEEFFRALATNARLTLHLSVPYGTNPHHISEALFKAVALALREAVSIDPRIQDVPSTKGIL